MHTSAPRDSSDFPRQSCREHASSGGEARFYLYKLDETLEGCACTQPMLRRSILSQMDLDGIIRMLPIVCSTREPLTVKIAGACSAWIDLPSGLVPAMFVDGADFGRSASDVGDWLKTIAGLPLPASSLEPGWAKNRRIDSAQVEVFARRMAREVATYETRRISWGGPDGQEFTVVIPPKGHLRFDDQPPTSETATVTSCQPAQMYTTALGELIVVPHGNGVNAAPFNPKELRRTSIRQAYRAPDSDHS